MRSIMVVIAGGDWVQVARPTIPKTLSLSSEFLVAERAWRRLPARLLFKAHGCPSPAKNVIVYRDRGAPRPRWTESTFLPRHRRGAAADAEPGANRAFDGQTDFIPAPWLVGLLPEPLIALLALSFKWWAMRCATSWKPTLRGRPDGRLFVTTLFMSCWCDRRSIITLQIRHALPHDRLRQVAGRMASPAQVRAGPIRSSGLEPNRYRCQ